MRMFVAANTSIEKKNIPMVGKLIANEKGKYVTLTVPQSFIDTVYDSIHEEGMEKPEHSAHISVMNSDETNNLDMPLEEDGTNFEYILHEIESCDPEGWDEMEKVWFIKCKSPQLENLRTKYGLTPLMNNDHNFHITIAVRPAKNQKDMKFSSSFEALQYLSDLTQKQVLILK
jgi:hypothetical protein